MTIDHGGVEETVTPGQLDFGMGMFTILDRDLPSGKALVRLSNAQNFYIDPLLGEPVRGQGLSEGMLGTFFPQLAEACGVERVYPHNFGSNGGTAKHAKHR